MSAMLVVHSQQQTAPHNRAPGARHGIQQRIALGMGLSSIVAAIAYTRNMLTRSGVAGTIFVGTVVWGCEGLAGTEVVMFFFVSSSLLSRLSNGRKRRAEVDKFSKSSTRDLGQTLANGGIGSLAALGHALHPDHPNWLLAAFVGAFASATADTWATELGTFSGTDPRLITSGHKVPSGTSGGITLTGITAAAAGALALGLVAKFAMHSQGLSKPHQSSEIVAAAACGGVAGALIDSLLGATVQQIRFCSTCRSETEQLIHRCGTTTVPLRGLAWINNDMVNLLSTAAGAAVAAVVVGIRTRTALS